MRVLIVSKTRMSNATCVGALTSDSYQNIRLLQPGGKNLPAINEYEVGSVWDIQFHRRSDVIPPHMEDVIVQQSEYLGRVHNIKETLLEKVKVWKGSYKELFDGSVRFTQNGSGYICERIGTPSQSVGFWMPNKSLKRFTDGDKVQYQVSGENIKITYVGCAESLDVLPAGSLLRVSLARWWKPDSADAKMEVRCYLQLSGWYL